MNLPSSFVSKLYLALHNEESMICKNWLLIIIRGSQSDSLYHHKRKFEQRLAGTESTSGESERYFMRKAPAYIDLGSLTPTAGFDAHEMFWIRNQSHYSLQTGTTTVDLLQSVRKNTNIKFVSRTRVSWYNIRWLNMYFMIDHDGFIIDTTTSGQSFPAYLRLHYLCQLSLTRLACLVLHQYILEYNSEL